MRVIQRETKLNRNGVPILDPPRRAQRTLDTTTAEREAKLRETEKHWEEHIKLQGQRPRNRHFTTNTGRF